MAVDTPTVKALLDLVGADTTDSLYNRSRQAEGETPSGAHAIDSRLVSIIWNIQSTERTLTDELEAIQRETTRALTALTVGTDTAYATGWVESHTKNIVAAQAKLRGHIDQFQLLASLRRELTAPAAE